jgi:hypothetical protein
MQINLDLNSGMASFVIGDTIDNYLQRYTHHIVPFKTNEDWVEYLFFDEKLEVFVDINSNIIESIAARHNCFFEDTNLINYDFDGFLNRFALKKEALENEQIWLDEDEFQTVYELPGLMLQVWVDNENRIKTIYMS